MRAIARPGILLILALAAALLWPTPEPLGAAGVVFLSIHAGGSHNCAVTTMSGVMCWGYNLEGELGDGTNVDRATPVEVCAVGATPPCTSTQGNALTGVTAISVGPRHSCALTDAGGVICWGDNQLGQLGTTTAEVCAGGFECSSIPIDVPGLASGVTAIAGGNRHSCALMTGGSVKCWGLNDNGQLGDDKNCGTICTPVHVCATGATGPCTAGGGNILTGIDAIAAGAGRGVMGPGGFTCARTTSARMKCWGENDGGQLGSDSEGGNFRATPVDVCATGAMQPCAPDLLTDVEEIGVGGAHACAKIVGGTLKCWGENGRGQVGDGTFISRDAPVDVCQVYDDVGGLCTQVLTGVVQLARLGDASHTCALVGAAPPLDDYSVKCWGTNALGHLGIGSTEPVRIPVPVVTCDVGATPPCTMAGGNVLSAIAMAALGNEHTCALTTLGSAQCWGLNQSGQLGDQTTLNRTIPVDVLLDSDGDGCTDDRELQPKSEASQGGGRNPKDFWDFFDVWTAGAMPPAPPFVKDGAVTVADIFAVAARFGAQVPQPTKEDALAEALTPPESADGYHAAYDRGGQVGDNIWNQAPPDGAIAVADIFAVAAQFGHTCA